MATAEDAVKAAGEGPGGQTDVPYTSGLSASNPAAANVAAGQVPTATQGSSGPLEYLTLEQGAPTVQASAESQNANPLAQPRTAEAVQQQPDPEASIGAIR